jgi:8-oxo-dGTP pyrophosphatase MutT (NUDIX family)
VATVPLLDELTRRLATSARAPVPAADAGRCAAVAVVVEGSHNPRVLLMKRVERADDPWSGHIALPGGGFDRGDGDLLETAIRETREELGIALSRNELLGSLAPLAPRTSGPNGIQVTPFVFAPSSPVEAVCGPEAELAFWLPLGPAIAGDLDDHFIYPNTQTAFPAWRYDGHLVWGLTRRILDDLLALARGEHDLERVP